MKTLSLTLCATLLALGASAFAADSVPAKDAAAPSETATAPVKKHHRSAKAAPKTDAGQKEKSKGG